MSNRVKRVSNPTPPHILEELRGWDVAADDIVIFLIGEDAKMDLQSLVASLREAGCPFAGAIVPAIIWGSELCGSDVLMLRGPAAGTPIVVGDLSNRPVSLPTALHKLAESHAAEGSTLLIFADGLTRCLSPFLGCLWRLMGHRVNYLGGGVAYSDLVQRPCLFTEHGIFYNAAIVIPLQLRAHMGIRHGWVSLGPTMVATHTAENVIHEINWQPAFDVYRDVLKDAFNVKVARDSLASVAVQHPLGLVREGNEELVRDLIAVAADGSLICVGGVRENSVLRVMRGSPESLIKAAAYAARDALSRATEHPTFCFVADCVSRRLYLAKAFENELRIVAESVAERAQSTPLVGFLSFGEIASPQTGWLDLHNKTVVTAAFYE